MCNWYAVVNGLIQAYSSQKQVEAQNEAAEAQADAAIDAFEVNIAQLQNQQGEINRAAAVEKFQRTLQGMRARAKFRAAAADAGVSGSSFNRLLGNTFMQESVDSGNTEEGRQARISQTFQEMNAIRVNSQSALNQAIANSIDPWAGTLRVVSSGAQGAASGYSMGKQAGQEDFKWPKKKSPKGENTDSSEFINLGGGS